jgi:hypothetical protein
MLPLGPRGLPSPHALMHQPCPTCMPPACTQVGATNSELGTVEQVVLGQPEEGFELPEGEPYMSHLIVRLQTGRRVKVSRTRPTYPSPSSTHRQFTGGREFFFPHHQKRKKERKKEMAHQP